jgi:hypothetical protein
MLPAVLMLLPSTRVQLNSTQRMLCRTPIASGSIGTSTCHRRRRNHQRQPTACSWAEEHGHPAAHPKGCTSTSTKKTTSHRRRQLQRRQTACSWAEDVSHAAAQRKGHTSISIRQTTFLSHHHPRERQCRHDVRTAATVKPMNSARLRPPMHVYGAQRTRVPTAATHPNHPRRACATSVPSHTRPLLLLLQPTPSSPSTALRRRRHRRRRPERRYTRDLVGRRRHTVTIATARTIAQRKPELRLSHSHTVTL